MNPILPFSDFSTLGLPQAILNIPNGHQSRLWTFLFLVELLLLQMNFNYF